MCKGPDEPGGPYRCPGHAKAAVDAATEAHTQAVLDAARAGAEARRAARIAEDFRDSSGDTLDGMMGGLFEGTAEQAERDATAAAEQFTAADQAVDAARDTYQDAAARYEATTHGLADLQGTLNAEGNPRTRKALTGRVKRAVATMNAEAAQRGRGGDTVRTYAPLPISTADPTHREPAPVAGIRESAAHDGITGVCATDVDSGGTVIHRATLYRHDPSGERISMTVSMRGFTPDDGVLVFQSERAADVDAAARDYATWAAAKGARATRDGFKASITAAEKLRSFLGDDGYRRYTGHWAKADAN